MSMDADALGRLIDAHAAGLLLYAKQWAAAADDCVHEAFVRLAAARPVPGDPPAWLYRVVRNLAVSAGRSDRRRKRREAVAAKPEGWFDSSSADALDATEAAEALAGLPAEWREVVVARLWGGLSFEQAGAAFGCSASTAFRRYESALSELRRRLGES